MYQDTALLKEVADFLRNELQHLKKLKNVLQREREDLVSNNIDGILECIKQKETLLLESRVMDESYKALKEILEKRYGKRQGKGVFEALIDRAGEPEKNHILSLINELRDTAQEVESLREGNSYLIRAALGHIGSSLRFLAQVRGYEGGTYTRSGEISEPPQDGSQLSQQV